jgi:hypothetical protein
MERRIQIGRPCRVTTKDGRTYVGTVSGYAEVASGNEMLEEIYLEGLGDRPLVIQLADVQDISQDGYFDFKPRD